MQALLPRLRGFQPRITRALPWSRAMDRVRDDGTQGVRRATPSADPLRRIVLGRPRPRCPTRSGIRTHSVGRDAADRSRRRRARGLLRGRSSPRDPRQRRRVEHHTVARPGGSLREWRVRWHRAVSTAEIASAVEAGADVFVRIGRPTEHPATTIHESPLIPRWPMKPTRCRASSTKSWPERSSSSQASEQPVDPIDTSSHGGPGCPRARRVCRAASLGQARSGPGPLQHHGARRGGDPVCLPGEHRVSPAGAFRDSAYAARWDRALWELRQQDADALGESLIGRSTPRA